MDKSQKKSQFRKKVLEKLSKKAVNSYKKDKQIIKNLLKIIKKSGYKNIMLYIPLKTEVNIKPLIKYLRQSRHNLYVPYIINKSFKLVKYRLPLHRKKFGIREPNISNIKIKNIDLAIVPILGIDKEFKRVGFGKGMYDRFYEKNNKKIDTTLFIARDLYYTDELITDSYDIKADIIVSFSKNRIKF